MKRLIGLALLSLLGGCAQDAIPFDAYFEELVQRSCENTFECCDAAERPYADMQACVEERRADLAAAAALFEGAVNAGDTSYDGQLAAECFAAGSCDPEPVDACGRIFQGTHPNGEACTGDFECESGWCDVAGTRSCTALPEMGQSCAGRCVAGAYCASGTCAARKADGEACAGPLECAGLACEMGVCAQVSATALVCAP